MDFTLSVTRDELNLIAAALNELPRRHVQALFEKLQGQVAEQEKAQQSEQTDRPPGPPSPPLPPPGRKVG